MFRYMNYGPYVCIGVVLAILFVIWAFCGGKNYDFVGLAPLDPTTCSSYTGSIFSWGNDPIEQNITFANEQNITFANEQNITSGNEQNITFSNEQNIYPVNDICVNEQFQEQICVSEPQIPPKPKRRGRPISKGERLCCQTMERIYGVPFKSVWPNWLINPETKRKLELDCYNEELQIAVEYNGEQHYVWPNFTNQSQEEFISQVRRDELKMELCNRNGVYLIVVPYTVPHNKIADYIMAHLPEAIQKRLQDENIMVNNGL